MFEGLLLSYFWRGFGDSYVWYIALGAARSSTLMAMLFAYVLTQWDYASSEQKEEETESLLTANGHDSPSYDAINRKVHLLEKPVGRAKAGWLGYFIGFRILFPYIWYVPTRPRSVRSKANSASRPSNSFKEQLIFLASLILVIAQRVINILVPWQLEILVGSLGRGSMPYKNIAVYVVCRALQGQQGILGSVRAILWIPVSQSLFRRLTCAAFEHVLGLSLDMHLSKRIGEVMSALNKGSALNTFLDGFAFQLFPMVLDLGIAAVYFLVRVDAFYSLIIIGVMWSYIYMTIYMAQWRARARREMAKRDREMDAAK